MTPAVDFENIPDELKKLRQWILWRYEPNKKNAAKLDKIPYTVQGVQASTTNPATWATFDKVQEVFSYGDYSGIGFVFAEGDGYSGIDLDACLQNGALVPAAQAIVDRFKTYVEVSPSGTGVKLWLRGKIPRNRSTRKTPWAGVPGKDPEIAVFQTGKYFCVTGQRWNGCGDIVKNQELLDKFFRRFFDDSQAEPTKVEERPSRPIPGRLAKWAVEQLSKEVPDRSKRDFSVIAKLIEAGCDRDAVQSLVTPYSKFAEREASEYFNTTWQNTSVAAPKPKAPIPKITPVRDELEVVNLSTVEPQPIEWLWPGRFAIGKLSIISGDPGLGKSFLTIDMAARISRGRTFVDSQDTQNPAGKVVILTAEDDLGDTVRPRLDAADADCRNVLAIESVLRTDPDSGETRKARFMLERDIETLERTVAKLQNARLIVIDPLSAYLGDANSNTNAEIRGLLAPLAAMAARLRIAVLCVHHLNKNGSGKAIYRSSGSLAFVAAARSVYGVAADPDDVARRLFIPIKNNIATDNGGLAYTIDTDADDRPFVRWQAEAIRMTADEAFTERTPGRPPAKANACSAWLRERLADGGVRSEALLAEAAQNGFSRNTCWRAKELAGVQARKTGFGAQGGWVWLLPDPEDGDSDDDEMRFP